MLKSQGKQEKRMITAKTTKEEVMKLIEDNCKACGHCCSFGGCIVLNDEVKDLAEAFAISEEEFKDKYTIGFEKFNTKHLRMKSTPKGMHKGPCVFLKGNKCSIHEHKPLHCRISSCHSEFGEDIQKWFSLKYFVNKDDPESIRQWNTFLKTNTPIKGGKTEELIPDKKKLGKILSYEVLK